MSLTTSLSCIRTPATNVSQQNRDNNISTFSNKGDACSISSISFFCSSGCVVRLACTNDGMSCMCNNTKTAYLMQFLGEQPENIWVCYCLVCSPYSLLMKLPKMDHRLENSYLQWVINIACFAREIFVTLNYRK